MRAEFFCIVLLIIENMKLSTVKRGNLEPKNKSDFLQIFSNLKLIFDTSVPIVSSLLRKRIEFFRSEVNSYLSN